MLRTLKKTARRFLRQHRALKAREAGGAGAMLLERLLQDNPRFHMQDGSLTNSWSIQPDTLRYIYGLLPPEAKTLETGCGQSTVVFAIAGARHTCVMPDAGEAERVRQYCVRLGVANNVNFVIASSDKALPDVARIPSDLDFVLIDGAHGFPAPIIDWHYTAPKLKVGGVLAVDDYRMPSVHTLHSFLCGEDEWELMMVLQNTSFFRKLQEPKSLVDWRGQKINVDYPGY